MAARPRGRRVLAPDFDVARAVQLVLRRYSRFLEASQEEEVGDAKAYMGHSAAGRAALAHAETVVRVAALVNAEDVGADLAALLAEARARVNDDSNQENEADDPAGGAG